MPFDIQKFCDHFDVASAPFEKNRAMTVTTPHGARIIVTSYVPA